MPSVTHDAVAACGHRPLPVRAVYTLTELIKEKQ
jgi:hypothetical protein